MNKQVIPPLTDYLHNKASRAKIPLSGTFELTPVCNFACRMCYVRKTAEEVAQSARPPLTLEQWLAIARDARDRGMLYILLTGGEPLLWPDFWELYEELIHMGMLVSVNTNGSLIDEDAVRRFAALPPRRVNITLSGADDDTYFARCGVKNVFARVDRAITALRAAGVMVKLNCSLTPYNVHDLEKIVAYAQDRSLILEVASYMFPPIRRDPSKTGMNDARFSPEEAAAHRLRCFRLQNGEERYRAYLENILQGAVPPPGLDESCVDPVDGKIRCRAGNAAFWITWDGYLSACGMMPEPKEDLTAKTFSPAWDSLAETCDRLSLSGVCAKCENNQLCHPCAAMAAAETGSPSGIPQYLCCVMEALRTIARRERTESNFISDRPYPLESGGTKG